MKKIDIIDIKILKKDLLNFEKEIFGIKEDSVFKKIKN